MRFYIISEEEYNLNMDIIYAIIYLVVGLYLLVQGGNWLITSGSGLAQKLGISSFIIGLTVLAFGTSLPELTVNIFASVRDQGGITIGNVLGSNIANIGLIIGSVSLFYVIPLRPKIPMREVLTMFWSSVLLGFFILKGIVPGESGYQLSNAEGWVLLGLFLVFILVLVFFPQEHTEEIEESHLALWQLILLLPMGLLALIYGGDFVTSSASFLALRIGISQTLIGLTIVSIGTSLPELITSWVAMRRGYAGMSLGNIIGSNIFNILLVLGASSAIRPLVFASAHMLDYLVMLGFTLALCLMIFWRKNLQRLDGAILFGGYVGYMLFAIWRG